MKRRGKYIHIVSGESRIATENDLVFNEETREILLEGRAYGRIYSIKVQNGLLIITDSNGYASGVSLEDLGANVKMDQLPDEGRKKVYALRDNKGNIYGEKILVDQYTTIQSIYNGHIDDAVDVETGEVVPGTEGKAICIVYEFQGIYSIETFSIMGFRVGAGLAMLDDMLYVRKSTKDEGFLGIDETGIFTQGLQQKFQEIEKTYAQGDNVINDITRFVHSIQYNTSTIYYQKNGVEKALDITIPLASLTFAGLMSAADKRKIEDWDGIYRVYGGHVDDIIGETSGIVTQGTGAFALCIIQKQSGRYSLQTILLRDPEKEDGITAITDLSLNERVLYLRYMKDGKTFEKSVDLTYLYQPISIEEINNYINQ